MCEDAGGRGRRESSFSDRPARAKPGGLRAMTEFQLFGLRRLDGVPRLVGSLWLRPGDVRRGLAKRAYWATARDQNRGIDDFLLSVPLGASGRRRRSPSSR